MDKHSIYEIVIGRSKNEIRSVDENMDKIKVINILVVVLFFSVLMIHSFFDELKVLGSSCLLIMGVLGIIKERAVNKKRR